MIVPPHVPPTNGPSVGSTAPVPSQLSVHVRTFPDRSPLVHQIVISAGAGANTGACVSITVIVCDVEDVLPQASV